jgi:DnaJ-class molecular chaperone
MSDSPRVEKPGDEADPGTPQSGENICPTCSGTGQVDNSLCPQCKGTGTVTTLVGDA